MQMYSFGWKRVTFCLANRLRFSSAAAPSGPGPVKRLLYERCRWNGNGQGKNSRPHQIGSLFPVACFGAAVLSYGSTKKTEKDLIHLADALYKKRDVAELYKVLEPHRDSKNAEVLWRLARAMKEYAELPDRPAEEKKKLLYDALALISVALELDDQNFACHKWYGILLSIVVEYEGTKKKLESSFVVKESFVKAVELCPTDATSSYILGLWYFACAELPWYQKKLAAAIFASPPEATYQEALDCFLEAERVDPNFFAANHLMIGKTYLRMGNKVEAKVWLDKVLVTKESTEKAEQNIKDAKELLKSI